MKEKLTQSWRPNAALKMLQARAHMLEQIRAFFAARDVLEVETPILSQNGVTDVQLAQLTTQIHGMPNQPNYYLQTSPEYPMKRLLAAYQQSIYQICKVFRDDERGRYHHTEFTMLEWYRVGWSHLELINELCALVKALAALPDLPVRHYSYRDLFKHHLNIDPWNVDVNQLQQCAQDKAIAGATELELDVDSWLDLLLSFLIQPHLGQDELSIILHYPPSQAALACIHEMPYPAAERFELYWQGVELANGFHELSDAAEQRARFSAQQHARCENGQPQQPIDEYFLAALEAGMPDSSGVALGLDRLLMLVHGCEEIDDVLSFTLERS